jgi:hypothetical protein
MGMQAALGALAEPVDFSQSNTGKSNAGITREVSNLFVP